MKRFDVLIHPSLPEGSVHIPPSKSIGHRALICAGLAQGISTVRHLGHSRDMDATKNCLRSLGAKIHESGSMVRIAGCSPEDLKKPVVLDAYESGSTIRFLIPVAACSEQPALFLGKPSLLARPMSIYEQIFADQNLPFEQSQEGIRFHGPLKSGQYSIPGNISSQFISGLLFAGPILGSIDIDVTGSYQSRSYVALTTEMMRQFGIVIEEPSESQYRIEPDQNYQPADVTVESDWSQAAFFLVLGMLSHEIHLKGLNPRSLQGDAVIASIVEKAGGILEWSGDILTIRPGKRIPFSADLADCPDLGPILFVLASFLPGTSVLTHTSRLRLKECDRIAAMEEELKKWGVKIEVEEDSVRITGQESWSSDVLIRLDGHNDHRVIMAMTVFGLCAKSESMIENAQAVDKSYPDFFEDLLKLKGEVTLF